MKTGLVIFGFALLLFGCHYQSEGYFYDFDTVDWYTTVLNEGEVSGYRGRSDLTEDQNMLLHIFYGDKPDSENDTLFLSKIESIGYTKIRIQEKDKVDGVNEIFREGAQLNSYATACIAVYRDILVFRKRGDIVGIVKICLACEESQIHGTKANTAGFGQSDEYRRLAELFKKI